ncbi:catabolic 3-dehydroquinase [Xylaria acuta]|nr:catabolic 3-dehydroquinase [Xylaria acuta]
MSRTILLINGPNLNLLGTREPHIYGSTTLADRRSLASRVPSLEPRRFPSAVPVEPRGRHHRQDPRGAWQCRRHRHQPGSIHAHTSVAIRDALSNVHAREPFRHHGCFQDKAVAVICGLGTYGYTAAIGFAAKHMKIKGRL